MSISMAITTFNRFEMTVNCFAQIIDDDFISQFMIMDDASTDLSGERLRKKFDDDGKVEVLSQPSNVGMSQNKTDAIVMCYEDFVLIADSDNIFTKESIAALKNINFQEDTIYCPSFAKPHFDYRPFEGKTYDRTNIKELINTDMGNCLLNTCNYVVPKMPYFTTYERNDLMKATDTIWFNYLWLLAGKKFYIVPGFEYMHTVHNGSGYLQDAEYNMRMGQEMKNKILAL